MKIFTYALVASLFLCLISCENDDDLSSSEISLTGEEILSNIYIDNFNSDINFFGSYKDISFLEESDSSVLSDFETETIQLAYQDRGFILEMDMEESLDGIVVQFIGDNESISDTAFMIGFNKNDSYDKSSMHLFFENKMPKEFRVLVRTYTVKDHNKILVGKPKEVTVKVEPWGGNFPFKGDLEVYDFSMLEERRYCSSLKGCLDPRIEIETDYTWLNNQIVGASSERTCQESVLSDEMEDFANVRSFELNSDGTFYMEYETYQETNYKVSYPNNILKEEGCSDEITRFNSSAKYYGKWSYQENTQELSIIIYRAEKSDSYYGNRNFDYKYGWSFMDKAKVKEESSFVVLENNKEVLVGYNLPGGSMEMIEKEEWRFIK